MDEMEQDEIDRRHGLHEEHAQGHESAKESSASEDRENVFARSSVTGGAASFFCVRVWGKNEMLRRRESDEAKAA